jgi:metal-dependent amidase/aminoacylase/carboxypeptidase family protein
VTVTLTVREAYKNLVNNLTMVRRFGAHLESFGRTPAETDRDMGAGSTDMGDVSHAVPSIHPWIGICAQGETTCHQHAFQQCAGSERGAQSMLIAAKAMALTTADLLADAGLRAEVKREFEARARA